MVELVITQRQATRQESCSPCPLAVSVIKVAGEFSPEAMVDFRNRLAETVEAGCVAVVLDLAELAWITERGMGLLAESRRWLKHLGGDLKLCTGASRVGERVEDFGLGQWLKCYRSVAEAIASSWTSGGGHVS